jgi:hypothetical protein
VYVTGACILSRVREESGAECGVRNGACNHNYVFSGKRQWRGVKWELSRKGREQLSVILQTTGLLLEGVASDKSIHQKEQEFY